MRTRWVTGNNENVAYYVSGVESDGATYLERVEIRVNGEIAYKWLAEDFDFWHNELYDEPFAMIKKYGIIWP